MVEAMSLMVASAAPFLKALSSSANGRRQVEHLRFLLSGFHFRLCVRAGGASGDGKAMITKEKSGWKIDYSGEKPATPLLDSINYPTHMKNLSTRVIGDLCLMQ
ncbi:hypothetical protein B296_00049086 [Ensete ventricosum]|uniref:Uncharacterized protein n=1 Tax=Ensete ventricosum TaxID=4639 RepID=A0A426XFM4_ENSVE|nr:hypothetical protein B296_00049086 [Ensete ventricosum]